MTACLCKGQASLIVDFEDFLNCIDIGSCSQVQTQVVLHGSPHDLLKQENLHEIVASFSTGTVRDFAHRTEVGFEELLYRYQGSDSLRIMSRISQLISKI